ncbi:MFS transporter [Paludibacterium yongneupense]|uniref:MFS transporter n=1 Tax=Paludibacterium yongneupense TaxID=400061 RepID=UPI000405B8A4|nr:MFS transporter [Paludibacterium yongneupense]
MFSWYREISAVERKTFWSCFGGWGIDALATQMFSLAIPALIVALSLSKAQAGMIGGATMVASALGGWIMGAISDRIGRVRALLFSIAWFAIFALPSMFAQDFQQLLVLRALQGFGFGGEWAAGAVLLAEVIRSNHRGKAMGMVQSAWAVGWGGSVVLYLVLDRLISPDMAWRVMFGVSFIPALLVVLYARTIPEPDSFARRKTVASASRFSELFSIFRPEVVRMTVIGALIGVGAHGGYYALMTWLPTFLKTERHLSVLSTGGYLGVIIIAFWFGCMASAHLLDRIGRRYTVVLFAACCVITVLGYVFLPLNNTAMLFLGFPLGFFAAGIPASLGALFNELYPSGMRGTGVGFCYNFGRIVSAVFPALVGLMSDRMTLGAAIGLDTALAYSLVVLAVLALPETRGKDLAHDAPVAAGAARTLGNVAE